MEIRKNWNEEKGLILTIVVLSIIIIGLFIYVYYTPKSTSIKKYSVDIIKITGDCEDCFDLKLISSYLEKIENIEIKNEKNLDYNSDEAKKLIDEYEIKRVPALILLSRKIDKIALDEGLFRKSKNAGIFDKPVPYVDLDTEEIKGQVEAVEIFDSSCEECISLSGIKTQLEKSGVKIKNYEMIDSKSDKGEEILRENNLSSLPTLLLTKNIEEYWWIFGNIESALKERENYYSLSELFFPYKEISTGKVKGKVKFTYIVNKNCEDCFNVTEIKEIFQGVGVYVDSERYVDINDNEGENFLTLYNITAIPTVILSREISDYTNLKDLLEQVGTFENDIFVFRKLDALKVKYQEINN